MTLNDEYGIRRPRLADTPDSVRFAVEELLGSSVVAEYPAEAGFTPSVASVVIGTDGSRLFAKAAPVGQGLGEAVEAGVALAVVADELGPRLVGSTSVEQWRVAAYEVVDGAPVTRWEAADQPKILAVVQRMRELMDPSPIAGTSPYAEAFLPLLGCWQALNRSADSELSRIAVEHVRGRPLPVDVAIPRLAELESRWLDVLAVGSALHHGDLRRDNVIRQPDGEFRIVDWTHLWTAPGWMDLVRLAPDLAACGLDPEHLLQQSSWQDTPAEDVNVALAGLSGRAWREGHLPELPGLPGLRRMQREQSLYTLRWLESRLGGTRRQ
ncbi:aminoglycoside phosphotransferase [Krasilnikovia sp. MM14-A1259]|uniref:aminoglycoside phosphotransferase n=1 Tax=Krasilnikovia sp. MM14-A1259 TaxID=3373539 RepID=UPI003829067E